MDEIDFLDFGASKGGSIEFVKKLLGGRHGVGVDRDAAKVREMRALGYTCLEADITSLELSPNSVRFVVMSHVLERLPSLEAIRRTVESAARVARDFLYIQGPYFDADGALSTQGLKFYWSDWHGHAFHLTTWELISLLHELGCAGYVLMGRLPVAGSWDPVVHPLSSPRDQHDYDQEIHPPKPHVVLGRPVHKTRVLSRVRLCVKTARLRWVGVSRIGAPRLRADRRDVADGVRPSRVSERRMIPALIAVVAFSGLGLRGTRLERDRCHRIQIRL